VRLILRSLLLSALVAACSPAAAHAYAWPLKPFDRQHAVRGGFDDPRVHYGAGGTSESFHFGIDISAPDGTPVYAVAPGTAYRGHDSVAVRQRDGHEFSYWHVLPAAREHALIRTHALIGYVLAPWEHVHFAESFDGAYVDPLRRGGLAPYVDTTTPTIGALTLTRAGQPVEPQRVAGIVDVAVEASDAPPLAPPPPWEGARVAPALIRWRLLHDGQDVVAWQTAFETRELIPNGLFEDVYAPGTSQNKPNRPGVYHYWLRHDWETTHVPDGAYVLEVEAADARGNVGRASFPLLVDNH
jgi:hypothetical protein